MRITDMVMRQGHLSEEALIEAVVTGDRPDHLDTCDLCTRNALEIKRWLDDTRAVALDAADEVFPPEKLAAQQAQIMRRIEQIDEPSRVIAFPAQNVSAPRVGSGRRIAPAWLGVAAAAGLVVGVISGQMSARIVSTETPAPPAPAATTAPVATGDPGAANASILTFDDEHLPASLRVFDDITPSLIQAQAR